MPLMDEFKEEREEIKNASFKKRSEYFWEYYKWWVIGGIIVLITVFMIVRGIVTHKKDVLYVAMINAIQLDESSVNSTINEPFLTAHDFDVKKNNILFDIDFKMNISSTAHYSANTIPAGTTDSVSITNSANARQTLSVYIAAASIDVMVSSENWFDEYAYGGFYLPLSEYLTEEELEKYSDHLYYYDQAVRDRYKKASDDMDYEYSEMYPDPYDLEAMENPVAVGIIADDNTLLGSNFVFATESKEDKIVAGVLSNCQNVELAHDLLISLIEQIDSAENTEATENVEVTE